MQRIELIKKLLPGFIPLFVFVAADAIWGVKIGAIVAVAIGLIQLAYEYFVNKNFDKFIIFDTLLIVALGGISILLNNDIFVKLKPALIEVILALILAVSVFSPKNILLAMSKRYMKDIDLNSQMTAMMNKSMKRLFFILIIHIALTVYSAYFMSNAAWAFISGGLFYIIFVAYLIYEFFMQKMKKVEYLPIVDENGAVIGKATRQECHSNPKLLHPVIRLHIFNSKGQILMQQRSFNKSVEPGKWDAAVAGHVNYGETAEATVVRETQEEIGITPKDFHFIEKRILKVDNQSELVLVYFTITDENPKADYDEVVNIKFCNIEDAISNNEMPITPAFKFEYNMLIKLRDNIFKNK